MSYVTEYNTFSSDHHRVEKFESSGKEGRRIFTVLNSNIKSLKTVGEYINTMYSKKEYNSAYKQMNERVRAFNFRSIANHKDARAITRSDIVRAAGAQFGGYDHAFVTLLLYLLLLDVGDNKSETVTNAKEFIDSLPVFIKRQLFEYAREIASAKRGAFPNDNVYLEMVVLYGDTALYQEFIQYIKENYPDEGIITNLFVTEAAIATSPISKRIKNFQSSALKKDALYTIIFYALDQFVRKCKMKGLRTGKKIIDAEEFLMGFFDYFNDAFAGSLRWLGKINEGEDLDTLKAFVRTVLTVDQKEEIFTCIRNAFGMYVPIA